MAQHGSSSAQLFGAPAARVHRPRPFAMTPAEVSLAAPRPDGERIVNEYVETPFRSANDGGDIENTLKGKTSGVHGGLDFSRGSDLRLSSSSSRTSPISPSTQGNSGVDHARRDPHHQTLHLPIGQNDKTTTRGDAHRFPNRDAGKRPAVVSKQPLAASFKKELPGTSGARGGGDCYRTSIICPECERCRCEPCRRPRSLPSRWLCNNSCLCSAETSLDYVSCLCCVKGLFYHCSKNREGDATCADDPCSCGPHKFLARWGCLSVLSLFLPCLWCYCPLKVCVGVCEKCYARYYSQGCRCEPDLKISEVTPEKRLLDMSLDF